MKCVCVCVTEFGPVDHEAVLAGAAAHDKTDSKQCEFLLRGDHTGEGEVAACELVGRWPGRSSNREKVNSEGVRL